MEDEKLYKSIVDKNKIINEYLIIPDKFQEIYNNDKEKYWIYAISRKKKPDKILYIGKTSDIRIRATQYYHLSTNSGEYYNAKYKPRKIIKLLNKEKIENFIMYPIYFTYDEDEACEKEIYYIRLFNLIDDGGYNITTVSVKRSTKLTSNYKFPHSHHTADGKRMKSKLFCIINPELKKMYICSGLKLAGDLIGFSKDNIKTAARRGIPRKGYYLIYLTFDDYVIILEEVKRKLDKGIFYGPKTETPYKTLHVKDYKATYEQFIDCAAYVKKYLKTGENKNNYEIKYVTQYDNDDGYIFIPPENFLQAYSNNPMKIYNGKLKIKS